MERRISFFSGVTPDVDPAKGWDGTCDFVLAASRIQVVPA